MKDNSRITDNRIKYFQSGVGGYNNDCAISKEITKNSDISVPLIFTLHGYGKETINFLDKVSFSYRLKIESEYKERVRDGRLKVKLEANKYNYSKYRLYRYVVKPIDVKYKITCKVSYIYPKGDNYGKTANKLLTYTGVYKLTDKSGVTYTPKGFASMNNINSKINSKTILQIMQETGRKLYKDLDDAHKGVDSKFIKYYDFKIYDDYKTDADEKYNPSQGYDIGADGEFRITTYKDGKIDPNDYLYAKGKPKAQLYEYEAFDDCEVLGGSIDDPYELFGGAHMTAPLRCVSNNSLIYNGSSSKIVTHVELIENNKATFSNDYASKELSFTFSNQVPNAIIDFSKIFTSLNPKDKYRITITILECTDKIYYQGNTKCEPGKKFYLVTTLNDSIAFEGRSYMVQRYYTEYYPSMDKEPLHGVVNGANDGNIKIHHGKNDFVVKAYQFSLDNRMSNHKITILTDVINPSGASIEAKFVSSNTNETSIDGDIIKVSSNYSVKKQLDKKGILSTRNINVDINKDITTVTTTLNLDKGYSFSFDRYELDVYSESGDILIVDKTKNNELKLIDNKCKVYATVEALQRATSMWNPIIHSGYYYMNQHEFYLYSDRKPIANYVQKYLFDYEEVTYSIEAKLSNDNVVYQTFSNRILSDTNEYCIVSDLNMLIKSWMNNIGYLISDVKLIVITQESDNFELIYDEESISLLDGKIYAKTKIVKKYSQDTDKIPVIQSSDENVMPYVNIKADKPLKSIR